jgi:hypothetical protein
LTRTSFPACADRKKADLNDATWAAGELELETLLMERKDPQQGAVLHAWIDGQS